MPTPGGKCATAAALRKFIGQALQSPALRQETTENPDERIRFAGSISFSASCTVYRVEKSHSFIAPLVVELVSFLKMKLSSVKHSQEECGLKKYFCEALVGCLFLRQAQRRRGISDFS